MKTFYSIIMLLAASNLLAAPTQLYPGQAVETQPARQSQHSASDTQGYEHLISSSAVAGVAILRLIAASRAKRLAADNLWLGDARRVAIPAIHASAWPVEPDYLGDHRAPSGTIPEQQFVLVPTACSTPVPTIDGQRRTARTELTLPLMPRPPPTA